VTVPRDVESRLRIASLLGLIVAVVLGGDDARATDTLARIRAEGRLRWGADTSGGAPFVFSNPSDPSAVIGFEVDMVAAICKHMGVEPELVRIDWNSLVPSLEAGRIDVAINGLEVLPERAEVVAFTEPYYEYVQQLTVRAADKDSYPSLEALEGKPVAVLNGTAAVNVLEEHGWHASRILPYDDSLKPYLAVRQRRAEAALGESIIASYYAGSDPAFFNVPTTFSPGHYAAAVRKADGSLLAEMNRVLAVMKENGELGEIFQRWGIWTDRQESIGVAKGSETPTSPLAHANLPMSWERSRRVALALAQGTFYTILLTVISMPLALTFGLVLALMTRSSHWWLRIPAVAYIQVIRGTPLLVQVYVIFFTLPQIGQWLGAPWDQWLTWPALAVGVLCLTANYAAYEAEIHRAGLAAVPPGQREAALSLGMSENQAFFRVVLPQSFRIILPPVINDLISMIKDSSLVSVVGVAELLFVAGSIGKASFQYAEMLVAAAAIYLVLSLVAAWIGRQVEMWLRRRGLRTIQGVGESH
jgi:polar amino acid transport system substrate-binding protein